MRLYLKLNAIALMLHIKNKSKHPALKKYVKHAIEILIA